MFGKYGIPGYDTDLFLNGYTYHTIKDDLSEYKEGTLQVPFHFLSFSF